MQQDNKNINIENKLSQLENQQLPDLSNMDKHWREMEQMLNADGRSKSSKSVSIFRLYARKLFIAASVISIVFLAWYFRGIFNKPDKIVTVATVKTPSQPVNKIPENSTAPTPGLKQPEQQQVAQTRHKAATQPQEPVTVFAEDIDAASEAYSREAIASFYRKLQHPVQEFKVSADKGGNFTASEGTVVTIPAGAFVDENGKVVTGEVKVKIEEFYKYSDMVAANLTTTSNGRQLISGGMMRITASNDNDENLRLSTNRDIKVLMPTADYDPEMKLFTTQSETGDKIESAMYASYPAQERNINWEQTGKQNTFFVFDGKTLVPDRLDQPYSVIKTGKKTIAKFALSKKSSLTPGQMEAILKEKLGEDYDVIKVIRDGEPRKASTFLHRGTIDMESVIGDSVKMTLNQALRGRYIEKKDSSLYAERIKADSIKHASEFASTQSAYSFSVKKLGWVNCDKYCNSTNKTNFVINLPSDVKADKFVSQVVFMSTRSSVMPGRAINNQIGFHDIPANMGVYVVGIGVRNGKVVSFMQKLKVDKPEVDITDLQETTPEAFRKKLAQLDMN